MFATIMYVVHFVEWKWIYRFSSIFFRCCMKKIDNYFNLDPFIHLKFDQSLFIYLFILFLLVCVFFFVAFKRNTCCFLWLWKQLCVGVNYTQNLHIMPVVVIFFLALHTHTQGWSITSSYRYIWIIIMIDLYCMYINRFIIEWTSDTNQNYWWKFFLFFPFSHFHHLRFFELCSFFFFVLYQCLDWW